MQFAAHCSFDGALTDVFIRLGLLAAALCVVRDVVDTVMRAGKGEAWGWAIAWLVPAIMAFTSLIWLLLPG